MYFTKETDPKIDFEKVDQNALIMLETARLIANIPFRITSHYRAPEQSIEVGGSGTDAHTQIPCTAFDIACSTSADRFTIIKALLEAQFRRVGINPRNGHIHVDCDRTKPQNVLWIEK